MNMEKPSVGVFLISILQNFGLVFDEDKTTADKFVLSSLSKDGFSLTPCVEILKLDHGRTKSFRCANELMFDYDDNHIYLPERISSHDLVCKMMELCGWTITDVSNDKLDDHSIRVSTAISPTTYNVVLILSDHDNGKISETRISYLNKILLGITIKDEKIVIYTEHKHVGIAEYEIVVFD